MEIKPKLLIVEDDEWNQKMYEVLFSKKFSVVICRNDEEFYTELPKDQFAIFIMDLSLLGNKDGIQLIKELRQMDMYKSTPIIVVTANAFQEDEQIALSAGATKFLRKPINNKVLLNELLKLLT